jgi:hypothetical protein
MSSSNTVQKSRAEILSEIDAFVDASIDKMDSDQLKQFNRKSDKIMKNSSRRMKKAAETRETSRLPLEVPRA